MKCDSAKSEPKSEMLKNKGGSGGKNATATYS